jgi:mRNA interferase MazF
MYNQWDIYYANLDPIIWKEQSWNRPVVIISWDSFNINWNILMVMPITSKIKNYFWDFILEPNFQNWLQYKSEILVFHIRSISTNRLNNKIWTISKEEIQKIINWLNILLNNL